MIRRFIKPFMDMVHKAAVQFLRYWRGAPWPAKVGSLPVLGLAIGFIGLYHVLYGCRS